MISGIEGQAGFDLDELDDLSSDILVRQDGLSSLGASALRGESRGIELDSNAWSSTDSTTYQTVLRRSLLTTLPFVLSDIVALAICGLITNGVLSVLCPEATVFVGRAAPIALFPLLLAYWMSDLYSQIWVHPVIELRELTHVSTVGMLTAAAVGILIPPFPLWCVMAWLAALVLVPLLRVVVRRIVSRCRWWGYPTLVIGTGEGADAIAYALFKTVYSGLRPVILTDPERVCRTSVLPVVNDQLILESLLRAGGIRHAVISLPDFSNARLSKMLDRYGGLIPHLLVWSDFSTLPALWGASQTCGRLSGLEVRNHLLLATLQLLKRCIDVTIASTVLLLGLPLLAIIAGLVKMTDGGSIFYGHTRIGRHGRMFKAWKFRSMHLNSDAILQDLLAKSPAAREEWERDQKLANDPRVTPLGKFLRKSSLDELPQVWNVLKGEMSLVGPRPIVKDEMRRYGTVFRTYTTVKPGITGLWQVSGRTDIGYDERVRLDEFYVRHWSPWLDIYILAKTIIAVLSRNGAC